MRQAILSLALFITSGSQAQFTTDHPVGSWSDGIPVTDLRTFDVDTDGDQDIFVNRNAVGSSLGSLSWFQNLGSGVFAPEVVLHAGPPSYATDFDVHDVDNDGDRDIAYLITTSDVILVRLFEDGAFGAPQVWGSQATGVGYLRFIDLPSIDWYWLVVQGTNGEARPYYSTGTNFVEYPVNGNGLNLTGVTNIEAGHITGYAGDIVVQTADHLYLYIIYDSSPDNYAWFTYDIGYCDDRIQVTEVNGYFGEEITRTNNDTICYTEVYNDIDVGMVDYTYYVDYGIPVGYGTFGRIDCDDAIDIRCHWTGGDNGNEPYSYFGNNNDGFYFDPPVQSTGATLTGSLPVLVDLNDDELNDLIEVVSGNSLHWYTNGGLAPQPVSFAPLDTLVNCPNYYYLTEGTPSGGYFTGPLVVPTFEFGEYIDKGAQQPGNYPVTYHVYDNNGCAGSETRYVTLIDSVRTIPGSLSVCPSDTPFQLGSEPAHAAWLSDNYVTTDGLLDISFPYQTDIFCVWTDVTGCSAYGSLPVEVRQTEYGDAHIYGWEGPDYLCTNGDPVQIYRTLATGGFELIPFDPATSGTGTFTFIGYADVNTQAGCLFDDTLFLQVVDPPVVTLDPFLDTLANTCFSGYPLTGGLPTDGYNSWDGPGTYFFESGWYFDAYGLEGSIPITYTHYDNITGCSNSATQPIVVIDSVLVVPDSIVTCPSPDAIQVLTYPNAVWGSNEVPNGVVDVSFPHQQHYLCYWMDVQGCGVYGALAVDVRYPTYGSTYIDCYCNVLCTNSGPVDIERTLADGTYDYITFDPAAQGPGYYYFVGYGDTTGFTCPVNDTLFLEVQDPPIVTLDPFLDTLVNSCQTYLPLTGGAPTDGTNSWSGPGVQFFESAWYFFTTGLEGDIPVTYTHYDDATGCSNAATQYITVIDSVVVDPDSVHLCLNGPGVQFTTIPASAVWASDHVTPDGTVLTEQGYFGYATCSFVDVLGCSAPGYAFLDIDVPNYGYAYINNGYEDDILCLNEPPVTIYRTLADGTSETIPFDPAAVGLGTYQFIGYGDVSDFDCAINDTLNVQVVAPPVVTLAPFTDTLVAGCQYQYLLTGGLPAGGYYYGNSVDDPYFYPFSELGQVAITYEYTDGNGCSSTATDDITVIDSVVVTPDSVHLCLDGPSAQFFTVPGGAVWASDYVTPDGTVLTHQGYAGFATCSFTDVLGCTAPGVGYVNVQNPNYGFVYIDCYCDLLCSNGTAVQIERTLPDGTFDYITFDPAAEGAGYYYFVGYGDTTGFDCFLNDTLFLQVVDPPVVTLDPFTDTLVAGCQYPYPLTGGLPAGGYYYGDGVDDPSFYPIDQSGQVPITYQYTDGNGCTAYDTEDITVIDQITAVPDAVTTCPDIVPVQLASVPPGALWSGSSYVSPDGSLDVSTPNNEPAIGTWTDVIGCATEVTVPVTVYDYTYGSVVVVGYDEPVSLCVNTPPVDVLVSQADGSVATQQFDPAQGVGSYDIVGFGPTAANCPVDVTLTIVVNDIPTVTLEPFTDTLISGCSGAYVLTGGLPAGGYYDGPGVDGDFFPFAQSGQVPITYQYTDGNGCTAYDTEDITVIDQITAVPDAVTTCPDIVPVQLASVPPGALWSGSSYVSPDGSLDVSTPNNEPAIGTWTDVIGCATEVTVPVTVYDYTYGSVVVVGYDEPVSLCVNTPPVDVLVSQADGSVATQQFDPSQGVGSYDIVGFGPTAANCPVDVTLTIVVNDIPTVTLEPFTDTLVSGCSGAYVLTGGLPAGGYYDGPGVDGDFFPFAQSGQVPITYQYTDGNGCTAYDTEDITVIDQITAVPDAVTTCPDIVPVQLASVPPGALWSGSSYVSPDGSLDVSTPNNEPAIGTWTDVIGCATEVTVPVTVYDYTYGSVVVVGYDEPVSLCVNTPPVDVLVSQADGSVATQQFDPSQGVGSYDIVGFGPTAANCPVDVTLTIVVNDIPTVTLEPFTDTLVNACTDGYALTGGSPAGGAFSGSGVTGDFFPQGLLGPVEITYTYADGNGCSNSASQSIAVIGQVDATPASITTCIDQDPMQLQSDPPGAIWSGSPNVTSNGSLDVSTPYVADIIGTWTDVIGCALQTTVPVTVNDQTYGDAYVEGIDEPVSLCTNGAEVNVVTSQADGSLLTSAFDPQLEGAGTYPFVGYAPSSAACPVNDTLLIDVHDAPVVTLAPFTDTLANSCASAYVLTGGLPVGGNYSGSGVNGDFFAEGLLGDIDITYNYTDAYGCSSSATGAITVIGSITVTPASVETCAAPDPIQLTSDMAGTVWSGSPNVTPEGVVDPSSAFTADIVGTWADVAGCELQGVVSVTVSAQTNGYAYVQDIPEPVTLCQDHDPVVIVRSLAAGGEETITFDPATQAPGSYTFTGFALTTADCPVDYVLTIEVTGAPMVTLTLPYEDLCTGSSMLISGGLPAGGTYIDYNGTGGSLDILEGTNSVTYVYADIGGCSGSATDQVTGFSVTEANGYDAATPDLCPDSDPLTFEPSPGIGTWGGVLTDPVFDPAADDGGAWSYTVTDDAGNTCGIGGTIVVLPYTEATLEAALTTVCVSGDPVQIFGTNALGGTIDGPLTLEDPLDPLNPAGTFDPSAGIGDYVFTMDVLGGATSCAQTLTVTIAVVDAPNVTVNTFTDTLLNICSNSAYTLTQGLPAGGEWSGPGVSDNVFSPFGLSGPQTLTYTYDAGPGCQGSATGTIDVVSSVIASPYNSQTPLYACEDSQPVQLGTVPGGAIWAGGAVTPNGFVDMADPFNGILSYLFTDATGCDYGEEVQAVISPYSYGSVTIEQPGSTVVCENGEPFNIILSTASGVNDTVYFDPAIEGPGIHPFSGVAPTQIDPPGCYLDYELTVQVIDSVDLDVTDAFAVYNESPFVLSGGQPAGGEYGGDAVNSSGEFMPGSAVGGWNTITYTITNGPCPGTATDSVYVSAVGITDVAAAGTMSVWPVPTRDELFISLPAGSADVLLTLVDADGREVAHRMVSGGANQNPLRWDIGSLANGSYALWTTGRGNLAPARVVIAH